MSASPAFLLIADIGGYTRFMRLHRMSLAHAQENTARLLEAVVDAAPHLRLVGVEGDSAFLYQPASRPDGVLAETAVAMHRAFHAEQQRMNAVNLCVCDGCAQTGRLQVKFVAHRGEVVEQRLKDRTTLAGVDVILLHRMLKNSVPVPEYVLMTEPVLDELGPGMRERVRAIEEELEGLGRNRLYFVDLAEIAEEVSPAPPPRLPERIGHAARLTARTLPQMLGLSARRRRSPHAGPAGETRR